jgi:hypothetical protein
MTGTESRFSFHELAHVCSAAGKQHKFDQPSEDLDLRSIAKLSEVSDSLKHIHTIT